MQNTSDQTNLFPVAVHKSPGLFGIQELEITRKALRVLVQLELSVKGVPLADGGAKTVLVVFLKYIYIFYTALCHVCLTRYFFCRE